MKRGLKLLAGCSATARQAACVSWLLGPTTKVEKLYRGSSADGSGKSRWRGSTWTGDGGAGKGAAWFWAAAGSTRKQTRRGRPNARAAHSGRTVLKFSSI